MQVEVAMFNAVIDSYDGGILYDLFGGTGKAKRGFLATQQAITREDFHYFPPELDDSEGDGSRTMLKEINRTAIIERRELAVFIQERCRAERIAAVDAVVYKRLFGAFLLARFSSAERALAVYGQEIGKIIAFNESLRLGLFGALIKSRMNDVTRYTAAKRVAYMREAMEMAGRAAAGSRR
jgi:hypothetical protein